MRNTETNWAKFKGIFATLSPPSSLPNFPPSFPSLSIPFVSLLYRLNKQQTRAKIKAARLQEKSRETAFRPPTWPTPLTQYSLLQPPVSPPVMSLYMYIKTLIKSLSPWTV